MNRRSKSSRRPRGSSKNPHQHLSPSDHQPQPSSSRAPQLLPPPLEKKWTANEVWALTTHTEKSWSARQFSDTPEYWNSIAPYFPGSSAEYLRNIHLSIIKYQKSVAIWNRDEIQTLIALVYRNVQESVDTPEWWAKIASHLPGRTAFDCRLAYNTFGSYEVPSKKTSEGQQQQTRQTTSTSTMFAGGTSSQRTSVVPPKTTFEGQQQQQMIMQPSVPSSIMFPRSTSTQRTSVMSLQNWTLEDYMFLMKVLTRNLHVDTDNVGAMESIASWMVGKTAEEVRHLILKWRPQLLAALEKADRRIMASSSGTKEPGTSDSEAGQLDRWDNKFFGEAPVRGFETQQQLECGWSRRR